MEKAASAESAVRHVVRGSDAGSDAAPAFQLRA
jgi:hypothetical protein